MNNLTNLFLDLLSPVIRPDSPSVRPAENGVDKGVSPLSPVSPGDDAKTHPPSPPATASEPACIPDDCIGALLDSDGNPYLPWAPHLASEDVRRLRAELIDMIEDLATLEGWPRETLVDVMGRAVRGPLYDLMPNVAHFRERMDTIRTEQALREALNRRTWRGEGFDDRREERS